MSAAACEFETLFAPTQQRRAARVVLARAAARAGLLTRHSPTQQRRAARVVLARAAAAEDRERALLCFFYPSALVATDTARRRCRLGSVTSCRVGTA